MRSACAGAPTSRCGSGTPSGGPPASASSGRSRSAQQARTLVGGHVEAEHGRDPAGQVGRPRPAGAAGSARRRRTPTRRGQRGGVEHDVHPVRPDPARPRAGDLRQVDARRQPVVARLPAQPGLATGARRCRSSGRSRRRPASGRGRCRARHTVASRPPGGRPRATSSTRTGSTSRGRRPAGSGSRQGRARRRRRRRRQPGGDDVLGEQRRSRPGAARRPTRRPGRPARGPKRGRLDRADQLEVRLAAAGGAGAPRTRSTSTGDGGPAQVEPPEQLELLGTGQRPGRAAGHRRPTSRPRAWCRRRAGGAPSPRPGARRPVRARRRVTGSRSRSAWRAHPARRAAGRGRAARRLAGSSRPARRARPRAACAGGPGRGRATARPRRAGPGAGRSRSPIDVDAALPQIHSIQLSARSSAQS